jgi:hypothetical protein
MAHSADDHWAASAHMAESKWPFTGVNVLRVWAGMEVRRCVMKDGGLCCVLDGISAAEVPHDAAAKARGLHNGADGASAVILIVCPEQKESFETAPIPSPRPFSSQFYTLRKYLETVCFAKSRIARTFSSKSWVEDSSRFVKATFPDVNML